MARFDPDTGERVVPARSRRPSVLMVILFIVVLGAIVWALVPKDHAFVTFSPAPGSQNVELPKAPAGSVSGVGSVPPSDPAPSTAQHPVTSPQDPNAPPPNPGP